MNFTDLKKNLKNGVKNNYLLIGEDLFLLSRAYNLILNDANLAMPDFNLQVFAGDDIDISACVQACNMLPMMDERRVVYVNASIKCNVTNANALKDYLQNPNPTTILIVNAGENTKEFEPYKSQFEIVDCNKITENVVNTFVVSELNKHGKTISTSALKLLFGFTNGDMSRIDNEIVKLVSYVGDNANITENDVKEIVTKSVDFQIYELTEALAKKNSVKVYEILDVLRAKKDSYRTLISLIYNHFRRLFHVSISKANRSELSSLLGVKEFAVSKLSEQAKLFGAKKLKEINDICMQLDYEVKQSATNVDAAIEFLVLTILNI